MKFKLISWILSLSFTFAMILILVGCNNSSNNKTESTDQEITGKDSTENAIIKPQQQISEPAIETKNIEDATPEKEKVAENNVNKQEKTPPVEKESGTTKKDLKPSTTSKPISKPEINKPDESSQAAKTETSKVQPAIEMPKSDSVTPAKILVEKEEPKVTTQPQPATEPVTEKPKEIIVTQAAKKETKVAKQTPGSWIVPEKDKNKSNPIKVDAESLSIGKSLYKKHCASCHGKTGLGDGAKAAQLDTPSGDFTIPAFQNQTDGSLFYKTREGKGDMPGYKKKIPDEEDIWHIVNYMRTLK